LAASAARLAFDFLKLVNGVDLPLTSANPVYKRFGIKESVIKLSPLLIVRSSTLNIQNQNRDVTKPPKFQSEWYCVVLLRTWGIFSKNLASVHPHLPRGVEALNLKGETLPTPEKPLKERVGAS
jgi:hypothetical protein